MRTTRRTHILATTYLREQQSKTTTSSNEVTKVGLFKVKMKNIYFKTFLLYFFLSSHPIVYGVIDCVMNAEN